MALWKPEMIDSLNNQLSRVDSITNLVKRFILNNQEPKDWFQSLDNLLQNLASHISQIQTTVERVQGVCSTNSGQDDWVSKLSQVVCEISVVLDKFSYIGFEVHLKNRVAYPCGRQVNTVGSYEPIKKLEDLVKMILVFRNSSRNILSVQRTSGRSCWKNGHGGHRSIEPWMNPYNQTVVPKPDYSKIKGFLRDARVLRQAYRKWMEIKSPKDISLAITLPQRHGIGAFITSNEAHLHKASSVLQRWNPFDMESTDNLTKYLEALDEVFFLAQLSSSLGNTSSNIKYLVEKVLEILSTHLKNLFCCLIDANADLHSFQNPMYASPWCRHSKFLSLVSPYGVRSDEHVCCYTCLSGSTVAQAHARGIIDPETGLQQSINETKKEFDGRILEKFLHMISQIAELASHFYQKKYDCGILIRPFNQAFEDVMTEKMASLGFHDVDRKFQQIFMKHWPPAYQPVLSESEQNFRQAHMGAIRVLFPWQKCLCDEIFFHLPGFKVAFYTEEADLHVQKLLKFADAPCQMDRIFQLLHAYEVLNYQSTNIISIVYLDDFLEFVGGQVNATLSKLKTVISGELDEIQNQIVSDKSLDPFFGNPEEINKDLGICALTCRVMHYIKQLSMYSRTLDSILIHPEKVQNSGIRHEYTIAFGRYVLVLVSCLKLNLKQKASMLTINNCGAAVDIFWMNNLNYIVQETERIGLRTLLEGEIQEQKNEIYRLHMTNYINSTWTTALSELTSAVHQSVDERLETFQSVVREIIISQAYWNVPDPGLCLRLREAVSEKVVPAYSKFLEKYRLDTEDVIPPDNLKASIFNLFKGSVEQ